jgi:hypothetical protein
MPKLADVLKQSGWSQEQIDALDARAMQGFTNVLTAAEQVEKSALEKEQAAQAAAVKAEADRKAAEAAQAAAKVAQDQAELNKRSVDEFWNTTYNPGVAAWEAERAKLAKEAADRAAEAAFYKAQRESYLGTLGIKPEDAPEFKPAAVDPAKPAGGFVPGKDGSPVFNPSEFIGRATDGMNTIANISWKYQTLYGNQPLPIAPSELIAKADQLKLSPMEYAARTFKFAEREEEQRQAQAKAHDDAIAKSVQEKADADWKAKMDAREAEIAAKDKLRAEQGGNNPDVRVAVSSKVSELTRQVAAKEIPDPLMMNENQRRAQTSRMIKDSISQKDSAAA